MQWLIQLITAKTNWESMENSTWLEYFSPYMFENGPASIANKSSDKVLIQPIYFAEFFTFM